MKKIMQYYFVLLSSCVLFTPAFADECSYQELFNNEEIIISADCFEKLSKGSHIGRINYLSERIIKQRIEQTNDKKLVEDYLKMRNEYKNAGSIYRGSYSAFFMLLQILKRQEQVLSLD